MKKERIELVHGSGNVFADFGFPNAPPEQLKALLAAKIIGVLEKRTEQSVPCLIREMRRRHVGNLSAFTLCHLLVPDGRRLCLRPGDRRHL